MKPLPQTFRNTALAAATLGLALLCSQLGAASAPALPHISMDVKRTQTKTKESNPSSNNNNNNNNNNGSNGSGSKNGYGTKGGGVSTNSNEIYYIISLHNMSPAAAKNIQVDYTIYNRTRTTTKGKSTSTIDEITGSETVDVTANGSKDIETNKVPHQQQQAAPQQSSSKNRNGGGNNNNNQSQTVTVQQVAGIVVTAKIGDAIVGTYQDPPDIKAQMDAKQKKAASGDNSDSSSSMDSSN